MQTHFHLPLTRRWASRAGGLLSALVEPPAEVVGLRRRSTARLLSSFLLSVLALLLLVDAAALLAGPVLRPPWYAYLIFGGAYLLTRVGAVRAASALAVAGFPLFVFLTIARSPDASAPTLLQYLVLSVFLGACVFSRRGLAAVIAANTAGLLLLPVIQPGALPGHGGLETPLAVNALGAALALVVTLQRDQAERERQVERRDSEERLGLALQAARMGLWDYDIVADRVTASEQVAALLGLAAAEPAPLADYLEALHPEDRALMVRELADLVAGGESDFRSEYRVPWPDARTHWVELHGRLYRAADGRPMRVTGTLMDITERKELELQLGQAQRMEAVGRLASGIAHDFNNLLTVILGSAQLALTAPADLPSMQESAAQIMHAAQRAATLTRQLLVFGRRRAAEPRPLDLNALVESTAGMLRPLIGEDIELALRLAPDAGLALADAGQIEQIIVNLAVNARDAMPSGGRLTIATARDDSPRAQGGRFVTLSVRDTGAGMDAATRQRIFEPFFTTKPVGKGTGLGLSTVQALVTQMGGWIDVESAPARGSTFTLHLPLAEGAAPLAEGAGKVGPAHQGAGTVLLVEDDEPVRRLAARILRRSGYQVIEAPDGHAALRELSAAPHVDLLVTDLVMPGGLSGEQLAEQVRARRPSVRVIYMSGYADAGDLGGLAQRGRGVVAKPFTPAGLTDAVRAALGR